MNQDILNDATQREEPSNSAFSFSNLKSKLQYENGHFNFNNLIFECRNSRKLVLLGVFIALFFDNMLMTTVGKLNSHSEKKSGHIFLL